MDGWSRGKPNQGAPLLHLFPSSSEPLFYSVFRQKQGECFYYVTLVWGVSVLSPQSASVLNMQTCAVSQQEADPTDCVDQSLLSLLVCVLERLHFPPKFLTRAPGSDFASSCIIYCVIYSHMFCVDTPRSLFLKQTGTLCYGLLSAALCFIHVERWKVLMWKMAEGELALSLFIV